MLLAILRLRPLWSLKKKVIGYIDRPPFSPDLNLIEAAWGKIRDYIAEHFLEKMLYNRLREGVKEAWEALELAFFNDLLAIIKDCY